MALYVTVRIDANTSFGERMKDNPTLTETVRIICENGKEAEGYITTLEVK